jgi:hypothetical protein
MLDIFQTLYSLEINLSLIETIAVFFSVAYVILAAKESIWCWAAALISVSIYIYICLSVHPAHSLQRPWYPPLAVSSPPPPPGPPSWIYCSAFLAPTAARCSSSFTCAKACVLGRAPRPHLVFTLSGMYIYV